MAGTINLPGVGPVKTGYVIAAGALTVGIVGYAYYKHSQNSAASAANTSTAATTASTDIDPQTGYPYGSPEDEAALQQLNSGLGGYGDAYASEGDYGEGDYGTGSQLYYDPADGLYDLTSPYVASTSATTSATSNTGPGTFSDNAYWTQYAISNVQGYSASDIQTALALYLSGAALTSTQMSIYQAAIAVAGPAPQPPATAAHLANNGGGATGTGSTGLTAPTGVHVKSETASGFTVAWNKVSGATGYKLTITKNGATVASGTTANTQLSLAGLKPKTSYGIHVAATNASGTGPSSAAINKVTK